MKYLIILILVFSCNVVWGDIQATVPEAIKKNNEWLCDLGKEIQQLKDRIAELEENALVILGEEWEPSEFAAFNWRDGKYPQNFVWIISTKDKRGRFTILQPGIEREWRYPPEHEEVED